MIKRSNPFFTLGGEPTLPRSARLLARVDQTHNGRILLEAVDADWIEDVLRRGGGPDFWREVGPDAPVSVLELCFASWRWLRRNPIRNAYSRHINRRWMEIIVSDSGESVNQFTNLHVGPREIRVDAIMTAEAATASALNRLLDLSPYYVSQQDIEQALPRDVIDWIAVYDVGQGSAHALLNARGFPSAYVDLGGGVLGHHTTFPAAFTHLCLTDQPPVIMSHWDWDHWSSGGRFPLAQQLRWIVPDQKIGIVHGVFASLVLANGTLMVWPKGLPKVSMGQVTIEKCIGAHRNDSGLAVLVDGPNGEPPILLPGDARYTAVPSGLTTLQSVVAPHHGAEMRSGAMPRSSGLPTARVAYSYGDPNQWDHPKLLTKQRHHAAGWAHGVGGQAGVDLHTVQRVAGLGHIGLSWRGGTPPSPPCGVGGCSQVIVQT